MFKQGDACGVAPRCVGRRSHMHALSQTLKLGDSKDTSKITKVEVSGL